jgi:hypothetical protein
VRLGHLFAFSDIGGYQLALQADGSWFLNTTRSSKQVMLAGGTLLQTPTGWQRLSLSCRGERLVAQINGVTVATVDDSTWASGYAGLASGYHDAWFDSFAVAAVTDEGGA